MIGILSDSLVVTTGIVVVCATKMNIEKERGNIMEDKIKDQLEEMNDLNTWSVMAKNEYFLIISTIFIGIFVCISQLLVPFGRQSSFVPILISILIYFLSLGVMYWHGYLRYVERFKLDITKEEQRKIGVITDYLFWFLLVGISMAKISILIFLANKYI